MAQNNRIDGINALKNAAVKSTDSRPLAVQRLDPFKQIPRRQTPQTLQVTIANASGGSKVYSLFDTMRLVSTASTERTTGISVINAGGIAAIRSSLIHAVFVTGFKYKVTTSSVQFVNPINLVDGDLNDQASKSLLPYVSEAESDEAYNANIRNVAYAFILDAYTDLQLTVNDGETVQLTFVIAGIDRKR